MEITINARHGTVPDAIRNQATRRLQRLQRLERRLTGGVIVFEAERGERLADARLVMAGGPPLVGQGSGPTLRSAMDRALERLETQLKRRRERLIDRRTRGSGRLVAR